MDICLNSVLPPRGRGSRLGCDFPLSRWPDPLLFDYNGDFERAILGNINARAHFLVPADSPSFATLWLFRPIDCVGR